MYFLIKLFLIIFVIHGTCGYCNVCVTLPLITTPLTCPICNQSEIDASASASQNGSNSEETNYTYLLSSGIYNSSYNYNWTTCNVQANSCDPSQKYRTSDGSCNNLNHPTWGMSSTAFSRILPAYYRNNYHLLVLQSNGEPRPLSRVLSREFFPDHNCPDNLNLIAMQYGQIVAHDLTISIPTEVERSIDCCNPGNIKNESLCLPIVVPPNDKFYSQYNVKCISEIRTAILQTGNCNGPAEQMNGNTHAMDASLTYGSTADTAMSLRELEGGKLKTQKTADGRMFLPDVPSDQKNSNCFIKTMEEPCYIAGDGRVNQNTELTVLQNVLIREHNRVAENLKKIHNKWNDETLYQESRAIVIAEFQHITFNEWLELYIGKQNMRKFKLFPKKSGYTQYNSSINFMIINSFTTSAYRIAHSGIQGLLSMLNYSRNKVNQVNISDWMDRPKVIQDDNHYDQFLLGLTSQPMQMFDEYYSEQITNYLFHGFGPYGQDLISLDIERGRDHGLAPYIYYLEVCTGFKARTFNDLKQYIPEKFIVKLEKYYKTIENIDLHVGSILEIKVAGTRFGPTSLCIIVEQFYRTKWGDRFWYEVGGQPHSLTKSQLSEIRKVTLSRLICDNSDNITNIAKNSFLPPSRSNKIVDCKTIPQVNLNKW